MDVSSVRAASAGEWDQMWHACAYSTYFHSRDWAEIWEAWTGGRIQPQPQVIRFADGAEALLPLSIERAHAGLISRYVSSPGGTFGGWLSQDELTAAHGQLLVRFLTRELPNLLWRCNPYDPLAGKVHVPRARPDTTFVVEFENGFDTQFRRWSNGRRYDISRARREGVTVRLAEDIDDWRRYADVYADTLRRWGTQATSTHDWALFRELAQRDERVTLRLAEYRGNVIAGVVCVYSARHCALWHSASATKYVPLRPTSLLFCEAMRDAAARGYKRVDLNPSGGHAGVEQFKRFFAPRELQTPVVEIRSPLARRAAGVGAVRRAAGRR